MVAVFFVFVLVTALVLGGYAAVSYVPGALERRRLERRLREVRQTAAPADVSVVMRKAEGALPGIERLVGGTNAGTRLARLIEQADAPTTPSAWLVMSLVSGAVLSAAGHLVIRHPMALLITAPLGAALPTLWLVQRRSSRLKRFEEQFPEALDLVSRAIRAGHAFQSALGMVAEELPQPVGPEFKKTFEQQNFGLPLRDALTALAERVPLLDVRFFVTAVAIQRDTGGNLAEILDNLSHVVRERFKVQRQVRVHTAHGRITGFVLLALPAGLGVALSLINPDHMKLLFEERIGQTMLMGVMVMQIVGFVWIRRVVKIEV